MSGVPGQGRKFDVDTVLDQAAELFWRHGYEGTSVSALTQAMNISAPSLYAAFGGKEGLFYAAIDRYTHSVGDFMERAFDEEPHAIDLIARLLREAATHYSDSSTPRGCLISHSATCVSPASQTVADYACSLRNSNTDRLAQRIRDDIDAEQLPETVNVSALSGFISAVILGMAQRGRDGATTKELLSVAETTLQSVYSLTAFVPAENSTE